MDPVTQIFQQARAPSGSGNDLFDAYKFGAQLNLQEEAQRIALQEQGLNIQMKRDQLERNNQIKQGQGEALKLILQAGSTSGGWIKQETIDGAYHLATTYPELFGKGQIGQALINGIQGARMGANAIDELRGLPPKVGDLPLTGAELDTQTGRVKSTYGNDAHFDPLGPEKLELRKREIENSEKRAAALEQQRQLSNFLRSLGLQQKDIDQAIKLHVGGMEASVPEGAPAPGSSNITITDKARPPMPAVVTKDQQTLVGAQSSASIIDRLKPKLNVHTVGPVAVAENYLFDKLLSNLDPALASKERADVAQDLNELRTAVTKSLMSDHSINNDERKQILTTVPQPGEVFTSPADTFNRLVSIHNNIINRAGQAKGRLHQEAFSDDVLKTLDDAQVQALFDDHILSERDALRWKSLK